MSQNRLEEAIHEFGQPSYMYSVTKGQRAYWFPYLLALEPTYVGHDFIPLRIRKKYIFFGEKVLQKQVSDPHGNTWINCECNVQAKWKIGSIDNILLGIENEQ